jgi:hypothetical protein
MLPRNVLYLKVSNMKKNYIKIILSAAIISLVGVYVIDYFSHLLFSNPMETIPYFLAKLTLYFIFSILFLSFVDVSKKEFIKVIIAGITVSLLWGFYYNILPVIMDKVFSIDFYPFGIALKGLTFLGMGLFGTGLAFGIVHTLAFIGGYYSSKLISKL